MPASAYRHTTRLEQDRGRQLCKVPACRRHTLPLLGLKFIPELVARYRPAEGGFLGKEGGSWSQEAAGQVTAEDAKSDEHFGKPGVPL